jgi:hypothetical protein
MKHDYFSSLHFPSAQYLPRIVLAVSLTACVLAQAQSGSDAASGEDRKSVV